MRHAAILSLALSCAACAPDAVRLVVDLKSDLAPGAEIFAVRVSLPDEERELEPIPLARSSALADPGVRVVELEGLLPSRARRVRAAGLDVRGEETVAVEVIIPNETDSVVTVVLSRDCRGVTCPGDGAISSTRCLGARCVEPECLTGAEDSCPAPACTTDSECPSSLCTVGRCDDGVCLETEAPGVCGASEFCGASGCQPAPEILDGEGCDPAPFVRTAACEVDCGLRVSAVAAAHEHTCVLSTDAEVLCFGSNDSGQLGTGDTYGRLRPTLVDLPPAQGIAVGDGFSCARLLDASIRCWGTNARGALGLSDTLDRLRPTDPVAGGPWALLSAGNDSVCAIDQSGALYCWGGNQEGQLGLGSTDPGIAEPTRVDDSAWSTVEVGQAHVCAIRTDGSLHCWGRNTAGNLGLPDGEPGQVRRPRPVGADTDWAEVDCAQDSCCAIKTDGRLFCWGREMGGSLGFGNNQNTVLFEPRERPDGVDWADVSGSVFHGCGLRGTDAWCWGRAIEGQLGVRQNEAQLTPILATPPGPYRDATVGRFSSFLIREDGAILATGASCGRLGTGALTRPQAFTELTR